MVLMIRVKIVKLGHEDIRLRDGINDMLRGHGLDSNGDMIIENETTIKTDKGCEYHLPGHYVIIGNEDTAEVEDNLEIIIDRLDKIFEIMDRNGDDVESCYAELVIRKRIKIG